MKKIINSTLLLLAASIPSIVLAQSQQCGNNQTQQQKSQACDFQLGWYIGGQLGLATTDVSSSDINRFYQQSGLEANSISLDDNGLASSLHFGYQFNPYWALEASYIDLGEREVQFVGESSDINVFYDNAEHVYPQSAKGLSAAVVASWSLTDELKVSGKLGYWHWQGNYTTTENSSAVGNDSLKGNDLWFGAELNYRLTERTQVYLTAQHFSLARDDNNAFGLGLRYYFGDDNGASTPTKKMPTIAAPVTVDHDNDGVVDSVDQCPNSDSRYLVDDSGCTLLAQQYVNFSLVIHYANDSFNIAPSYDEKIMALADFIKTNQVKKLVVYGHTSALGAAQYNQSLSLRRANHVRAILAAKFGISVSTSTAIGQGESKLKVNENTEQAHQQNRRIELNIDEHVLLPVLK